MSCSQKQQIVDGKVQAKHRINVDYLQYIAPDLTLPVFAIDMIPLFFIIALSFQKYCRTE
jgi:hypothetical protein